MRKKGHGFPVYSLPPHLKASPLSTHHWNSALVSTEELILTHHNQLRSILYIAVHPCCCTFHAFWYLKTIYTASNILCATPILLSISQSLVTTVLIAWFFLSRILHCVVFLKINFYWDIVDLQALVSNVQQNESVVHIHISTLF